MAKTAACVAFVALAFVYSTQGQAADEKMVVPLVNGMTVKIGESAGKMEARVKGFGPGFCAGSITVFDETTSFSAPPLVWGEWFTVFEHVTGMTVTVSYQVVCDTDIVGEIRYWP